MFWIDVLLLSLLLFEYVDAIVAAAANIAVYTDV